MSVINYHNTLCNIPEECSCYLLYGGSLRFCCISDLNVATVKHVTVLIANQVTTWSRIFPEEVTGPRLARNVYVFYGTAMFSTTLTKAPFVSIRTHINKDYTHCYLLKIHFSYTLQSKIRLPSGLLSSGLSTKTLHATLLSTVLHTYSMVQSPSGEGN